MTMKRTSMIACLILVFSWGQCVFAAPGQLFRVTAGSNALHGGLMTTPALSLRINTTIPGQLYQSAGISFSTPGCTITNPGVDCTPTSNGYCLFAVSDTHIANIRYSCPVAPQGLGNFIPETPVSVKLCLRGDGHTASCESHTVTVGGQT